MSQPPAQPKSSVTIKCFVAVSGALLAAFVFFHMLGNLQIYRGPEALNSYAAAIKSMPIEQLTFFRLILLAALVVHVWGIAMLTRRNRAARGESYTVRRPLRSSFASRHMLMTGLVLLAFVTYHLLHFTFGTTHPEHFQLSDGAGRQDVYSMVVLGFREPLVAISYMFTMGLLGLHLGHGIGSAFRSTGRGGARIRRRLEGFGRLVALLVVIGNVSIPLSCLLGLLEPLSEVL